ncbi:hypothetical protein GCM10009735_80490 [Actinomadura chokoriensis]
MASEAVPGHTAQDDKQGGDRVTGKYDRQSARPVSEIHDTPGQSELPEPGTRTGDQPRNEQRRGFAVLEEAQGRKGSKHRRTLESDALRVARLSLSLPRIG